LYLHHCVDILVGMVYHKVELQATQDHGLQLQDLLRLDCPFEKGGNTIGIQIVLANLLGAFHK
jgi:hypothetical protein